MDSIKEEWRPVVGYEGLYEVSDWGNVRSLNFNKTSNIGELKKVEDKDGYLLVTLWKDKKHSTKKVHRLVAEAFIPNPENKPIVGHLLTLSNGLEDKTANEVWNIAWMTQKENSNYGTLKERKSAQEKGENAYWYGKKFPKEMTEKMSMNNYKCKSIEQYSINGELLREYHSINSAAKAVGCDNRGISRCCNGEYKQYKGFVWRYKDEDRAD